MSFLHPFFLIALGGAAAPILIHFLTRDRVQYVAFSTVRFFAKGAKLVVQRKNFQELILLLMRVLLAILLVIIFARPFFKSKVVDNRQSFDTARVVVADVSASMRRTGLPDALKKEATDALDSLKEDSDAAALIAFSDSPNVVEPLGNKIAQVKTAAAALAPGYGGTNIGEALRKANDLLHAVKAQQKEIVLISDLQREGWRYFKGDWKLAENVKLVIKTLKPTDDNGKLAIVDADVPHSLVLDKQPSSIAVRVANYSDKPCEKLNVTLELGGKKIDTQQLNIRANGTAAMRFRHVFDTPGDNPGSVTIAGDPSVPGGNVFYFNARVIPRIPILLVNGKPSSNPLVDASFFIDKALAPDAETPFDVKVLTPNEVTPQAVGGSLVVILANVGSLPTPATEALSALLSRGGGIFFLPGDQVRPDAFNAQFAHVAPCKLREVLQAKPANGETAESLTRIDFDHPIFETFSRPHHGDLSLPKFAKYWETTDTQLSHVLARFGDGRPAIVEREIDKGVSMILVSAIDPKWNDFAYQSVFLPYLHQTMRYLAVRTELKTNFSSGDLLPVPEGNTLKNPKGEKLAANETSAADPGFYPLLNKEGKTVAIYAVNGNFSEANPAVIAGDEISAAIERAPGELGDSFDIGSTSGTTEKMNDHRIWWYLLCGLLCLSFAELVVGNKTLRH